MTTADEAFGGHTAIALGIEDGLREAGAELHGCTPSMLVLSIQKRIAAERSLIGQASRKVEAAPRINADAPIPYAGKGPQYMADTDASSDTDRGSLSPADSAMVTIMLSQFRADVEYDGDEVMERITEVAEIINNGESIHVDVIDPEDGKAYYGMTLADIHPRIPQSVQVEVTTAEELDALPLDAVVVDFAGVPRTKRAGNSHMPGGWTHAGNSPLRSRELADGHPMQVIYAGRAALGGGDRAE